MYFLRATTMQGNTFIQTRLDIAFYKLADEIHGETYDEINLIETDDDAYSAKALYTKIPWNTTMNRHA